MLSGDKGVRGPWLSPGRDCARSAACHGFLWVSVSANSALARSAGGCRKIAHPALSFAASHASRSAACIGVLMGVRVCQLLVRQLRAFALRRRL